MAGSAGDEICSGYSANTALGTGIPPLLLRSFLERIVREFSTTCIEPLHSLIVSYRGKDISCKVLIALSREEMCFRTQFYSL
mgnify:CR=1 FL=1